MSRSSEGNALSHQPIFRARFRRVPHTPMQTGSLNLESTVSGMFSACERKCDRTRSIVHRAVVRGIVPGLHDWLQPPTLSHKPPATSCGLSNMSEREVIR